MNARPDSTTAQPQPQFDAPSPRRKRGRPTRLDEERRKELCLIIRVGCSVRAAAALLGIKEHVVRYARRKNTEFDQQVRKAERNRNLLALQNIATAGKKSWRASAWVLRSAQPDLYDHRHLSVVQSKRRLKEMVTKLVNELVPVAVRRAEFAHDDAIFAKHPFEMTPSSAPPTGAKFNGAPPHDAESAIDRFGERLDEIEAKYGPNVNPERVLNELFPDLEYVRRSAIR